MGSSTAKYMTEENLICNLWLLKDKNHVPVLRLQKHPQQRTHNKNKHNFRSSAAPSHYRPPSKTKTRNVRDAKLSIPINISPPNTQPSRAPSPSNPELLPRRLVACARTETAPRTETAAVRGPAGRGAIGLGFVFANDVLVITRGDGEGLGFGLLVLRKRGRFSRATSLGESCDSFEEVPFNLLARGCGSRKNGRSSRHGGRTFLPAEVEPRTGGDALILGTEERGIVMLLRTNGKEV